MAWSCVGQRLGWISGKALPPEGVGHWNSSPGEWSQHQPGRVQEVFGQCSQAQGVTPGDSAVQSWELDLMILVSPFQLCTFCDSEKLLNFGMAEDSDHVAELDFPVTLSQWNGFKFWVRIQLGIPVLLKPCVWASTFVWLIPTDSCFAKDNCNYWLRYFIHQCAHLRQQINK